MDPNRAQIDWSQEPAPWRPGKDFAASVSRPPRRGKRSAVTAVTATVAAPWLVINPLAADTFYPVWMGVAGAVALLCAAWAESLPAHLAAATPPLRLLAHALGAVTVVALMIVLVG
ncbi:MAG TPA: hypothetical protein VK925_06445 [Jiangellaceae bacterium]|nr:hypothetical protein [Jiangellaceae bacterium]